MSGVSYYLNAVAWCVGSLAVCGLVLAYLVSFMTEADEIEQADRRAGTWKPCANPQCCAPIPSRARGAYCSPECKATAARLRARVSWFADNPDTSTIPF